MSGDVDNRPAAARARAEKRRGMDAERRGKFERAMASGRVKIPVQEVDPSDYAKDYARHNEAELDDLLGSARRRNRRRDADSVDDQ